MTGTTEATAQQAEEPRILLMSDYDQKPDPEAETASEEAQEEQPEEQEPEAQPEPEKKRDANTRIRELNARNKEIAEENARLKAMIDGKTEPQQQQPQGLNKPNPEDYQGGIFNDEYRKKYEQYTEEQIEIRVQEAIQRVQQEQAINTEREAIKRKENSFRQTHPDYDDVLAYANSMGVFNDGVADVLVGLDNVAEIVYEIGSNHDFLEELVKMTPAMRLIKIGSLLGKAQPATQRQESKAPPPVEPVKGGTAPVLAGEAAMELALKARDYDAYRAAKRAIK